MEEKIREFAMSKFGKLLSELASIDLGDRNNIEVELGIEGYLSRPLVRTTSVDGERDFSREGIRDFLYSGDAFVLPTRGEGWGLPIGD